MLETQSTNDAARDAGQPIETQKPTPREIARETLAYLRAGFQRQLEICDKAEEIMVRLPESVIEECSIVCEELLIYGQDREGALSIIRALGGHWEKRVCPCHATKIDYRQEINGVMVEIYAAEPPASCKIIEEQVYVPAHNATKRTLVCR